MYFSAYSFISFSDIYPPVPATASSLYDACFSLSYHKIKVISPPINAPINAPVSVCILNENKKLKFCISLIILDTPSTKLLPSSIKLQE